MKKIIEKYEKEEEERKALAIFKRSATKNFWSSKEAIESNNLSITSLDQELMMNEEDDDNTT
jgi:hypothetical protein